MSEPVVKKATGGTGMISYNDAMPVIQSVMLQLTVPPERRDRSPYKNLGGNLDALRDPHYQRLLADLSEPIADNVWQLIVGSRGEEEIRRSYKHMKDCHGYKQSLARWQDDIQFLGAYLILWANDIDADDQKRCKNLEGTYWYRFFLPQNVPSSRMYEVIFPVNNVR